MGTRPNVLLLLKALRSDYLLTFLGGAFVALSSLIVFKIVLLRFGAEQLEQLTILRRYQAFLLPIIMFGFGVTVPIEIARSPLQGSGRFLSAVIVCMALYVSSLFTAFFAADQIWWLLVLLSFNPLCASLIYAHFRGSQQFLAGTLSNFLLLGIVAIGSSIIAPSFAAFVLLQAVFALAFFTYFLYRLKKNNELYAISFDVVWIKRSAARVPGDIIGQLYFVLPVFVLAQGSRENEAAVLAFALSMAGLAMIPAKPFSTVLLTRFATLKNADLAREKIGRYIFLCCIGGALLSALFWFSIPMINSFYFASGEFEAGMRGITVFLFLQTVYIGIRSIVDVKHQGPFLSYANAAGFAFLAIFYFFFGIYTAITLSYAIVVGIVIYMALLDTK